MKSTFRIYIFPTKDCHDYTGSTFAPFALPLHIVLILNLEDTEKEM